MNFLYSALVFTDALIGILVIKKSMQANFCINHEKKGQRETRKRKTEENPTGGKLCIPCCPPWPAPSCRRRRQRSPCPAAYGLLGNRFIFGGFSKSKFADFWRLKI